MTRLGFEVSGDEGLRIDVTIDSLPPVVVRDRVEHERLGIPEPRPPVDGAVQLQQQEGGASGRILVDGDRVQRRAAEETVAPMRVPVAGRPQGFIEKVVVIEGDAGGIVRSAMTGESRDVVLGDFALSRSGEPLEKRPFQFRQQKPKLVDRVVVVVIWHQLVEPGHQTFDVDKPLTVLVPLRFEQLARLGQAATPLNEAVVVEVVDEQGRVRDESAGEPGARNEHLAWQVC